MSKNLLTVPTEEGGYLTVNLRHVKNSLNYTSNYKTTECKHGVNCTYGSKFHYFHSKEEKLAKNILVQTKCGATPGSCFCNMHEVCPVTVAMPYDTIERGFAKNGCRYVKLTAQEKEACLLLDKMHECAVNPGRCFCDKHTILPWKPNLERFYHCVPIDGQLCMKLTSKEHMQLVVNCAETSGPCICGEHVLFPAWPLDKGPRFQVNGNLCVKIGKKDGETRFSVLKCHMTRGPCTCGNHKVFPSPLPVLGGFELHGRTCVKVSDALMPARI